MLLFVYGTLKNRLGYYGGDIVESKDYIDGYTLYSLTAFPAAKEAEGKRIRGQVWEIPEVMIHSLDSIEGVPFLYTRERATTEAGHEVFFYVFARDVSQYPEVGEVWDGRY